MSTSAARTPAGSDPARGRENDPAFGWEPGPLDLDAYLERIGHRGPVPPTLETLRALNRAHAATMPFENLDVLLGEEIRLDIAHLQDKLVRRRRGGYCHEHNILFATVLDRLGYRVTGRSARMLFGAEPERLRAIGHTLLHVEVAGREWLVDTGVGNIGPLEPLLLADGHQAHQGGWTYRVDRTDRGWWLVRLARPGGWFPLYNVPDERYYRVDFEDHNHIAAHHPRSPFTRMVVAQLNGPDKRIALTDRTLVTTRPGAEPENREVAPAELPRTLHEVFGLYLDKAQEDELARLAAAAPAGREVTGGD